MANPAFLPEQDSITCEIDIAAPVERVFQAIADPAQARQWANTPEFQTMIWEMEARKGGKWRFVCKETGGKPNKFGVSEYDHHGEILEIEPPRLLVYTWLANFHDDPKHKTVVRWELTPIASGTRLKVTHSGLAQEPKSRVGYATGWPGLLQIIKTHVEEQSGKAPLVSIAVTPDQDAVVSETHIAAPPERVFEALIDPKQVMLWWTDEKVPIESFSFEPRRGGRWRYDTKQSTINVNGISKFHCEGEVLEFDPPRALAYTWIANWHDDPAARTVVRWELAKIEKGTHLKITHSGLKNLPASRKDYSSGWQGVVGQLKNFVEKQ